MLTFIEKLRVEYPIPSQLSIWGGNEIDTTPVESLPALVESCVDELKSDILITAYQEATGMTTYLPPDTVCVVSATLSGQFPFQGNRYLKCTFDKSKCIAYLRYYPAVITYRRTLKIEDLEVLTGDELIYAKSYILSKMAKKELMILKTADMNVDNGVINLSTLESFSDEMQKKYTDLKPEILIYGSSY